MTYCKNNFSKIQEVPKKLSAVKSRFHACLIVFEIDCALEEKGMDPAFYQNDVSMKNVTCKKGGLHPELNVTIINL